jgi:hypothetical protein
MSLRRFWAFSDGIFSEETSKSEEVVMDTVFNEVMRPVFSGEPEEVLRRLRFGYSESWVKVCIGKTGQIVSISEYLYAEKYEMVVKTLEELLRKKDLAVFRRNPERLQEHLERTARKLIDRILEK